MRLFVLFLICIIPLAAWSQDRAGNDTPGEWVIDHHKAFGLWDSMCDHRTTDDLREERCYIRYVEVFSPRPQFGAQFFFLTQGPSVEFGMEAGTLFNEDGFRIMRDNSIAWAKPQAGCLVGLACLYEGQVANDLVHAMANGSVFAFNFIDRHGQPQALNWDLSQFAGALKDFNLQSAKRGL